MIIKFRNNQINQRAIDSLLSERPQEVFDYHDFPEDIDFSLNEADDTLILLDLTANGVVQSLLAPEIIVEELSDHGFLSHVKEIKILISDTLSSQPISVFSWELCQKLIEFKHGSSISITYVGENDGSSTLIEPPIDSDPNWIVHVLPFEECEAINLTEELEPPETSYKQKDYFGFFKSKMPNILFKGNISALFDDCTHRIDPDIVRKTYNM